MENIRLYSFDQLKNPTIVPQVSIESFDPNNSYGNTGTVYTITITNRQAVQSDFPQAGSSIIRYADSNLLTISATATWTNKNITHSRTMQTFASYRGIQKYVQAPK